MRIPKKGFSWPKPLTKGCSHLICRFTLAIIYYSDRIFLLFDEISEKIFKISEEYWALQKSQINEKNEVTFFRVHKHNIWCGRSTKLNFGRRNKLDLLNLKLC